MGEAAGAPGNRRVGTPVRCRRTAAAALVCAVAAEGCGVRSGARRLGRPVRQPPRASRSAPISRTTEARRSTSSSVVRQFTIAGRSATMPRYTVVPA